MKVNIVSIGNSKGIRIPKSILDQCKFNKEAELEVENNRIIIKPLRKKSREGWDSRQTCAPESGKYIDMKGKGQAQEWEAEQHTVAEELGHMILPPGRFSSGPDVTDHRHPVVELKIGQIFERQNFDN